MEHLLSARARSTRSSVIRELLRLTERPGILSLAGGLPAPELFPVERLRAAADVALGARGLQYGPTEGVAELRALVAERLPATAPEDVLVTTGSQQALDLLARCLLDPGDPVVVEGPSYVGALQAFEAAGGRCVPITSDRDGLAVDVLEDRLVAGLRPKLVYVVTELANPSGATLAEERRAHLAALSDRYGFVVVEDDPYGELRWAGERQAPLRGRSPHVVTLGTASKVLVPGLRVGWMAGPAWLLAAVGRAKQAADLHTSTAAQLLVAGLLADVAGQERHVTSLRAAYRERAVALHTALPAAVEAAPADGGMFLWARVPGVDTAALLPVAVGLGVAFVPGTAFHPAVPHDGPAPGREHLRLSFATLPVEALHVAAARLGEAIDAVGISDERDPRPAPRLVGAP